MNLIAADRVLARTVTYRLHALHKLTDRASQPIYEHELGLPLPIARSLTAVGAFSPLSVLDLAARANLDKAQASRAARELEAQGLVKRSTNPDDARGLLLTLTAKGQRLHERAMRLVLARNAAITATLSAQEKRQLDTLLDKLVAHAMAGNDAS